MPRTIRIGTRGSALARWQTDHVAGRLRAADRALALDVVTITTAGDALPEVPLAHLEGMGFFTSALERALLAGEIDVAVHSMKDLPIDGSPDLAVGAVPERAPVEDALVARAGLTLATLPARARVGTSSARRTAQLRAMRPDLVFEPLRGNVPTRIERVRAGDLDAVVLARAGLERLGLAAHVTEILPVERVLPAPAQGALAVQARRADHEVMARLATLDHPATRRAVEAERTVLALLGGGCAVPVGAHARDDGLVVRLVAGVFDPQGGAAVVAHAEAAEPERAAEHAARQLVAGGARALLEAHAKTPLVEEERR
jgi:hydroxymethylbilane synthase